MDINYKRRELNESISDMRRDELKHIVLWTIEGYKYFYLKYIDSDKSDEYALKLANATGRVLNYLGEHMLFHDEKEKYKLIQNDETIDKDIDDMKELFNNCFSLKVDMPKVWYKKFMELYLDTDGNFDYTEEYNDFSKLILAAGSLSMHKDEIEKVTGKRINLIQDESEDEQKIIRDTNFRRRKIIECDSIPVDKKINLLRSISYLNDYQLMVNDELLDSEYYMADDFSNEKVKRPRL